MTLKKLVLGIAAGASLLSAAPVFAHPPGWAPAHGWRAKHAQPYYPYYRAPAYVVVPARPVYVAPPPVVYVPPPRPVFYGTIPVSPGFQVGFRVGM